MIYGLKRGVGALLPGPLYHSAPNSFASRRPSRRRAGDLPGFDAGAILRMVDTEKIDTIFMVPTMFIRLMKLPEDVRKITTCRRCATSSMPRRPVRPTSSVR